MIILDAGHGGYDPGGGSNVYFKEKNLTKEITDYQFMRLKELGLPVELVRKNDETLTPNERINVIKNLNPKETDILISNHINTGGSNGGEVIYSIEGTNELPTMIAQELNKAGLNIRNVYTRLNSSGQDYYFILRDTVPKQSMIIEYGFADNPTDTYRLLYEWPNLAESVIKALANYYQIPYVEPAVTIYIVKPDDTLYKIAQKYNTTIETIKKNNNLTENIIYPGAKLLIS